MEQIMHNFSGISCSKCGAKIEKYEFYYANEKKGPFCTDCVKKMIETCRTCKYLHVVDLGHDKLEFCGLSGMPIYDGAAYSYIAEDFDSGKCELYEVYGEVEG